MRITIVLALLLTVLCAMSDLSRSYPSSGLVLKEFDIDRRYIQNQDFLKFVENNEKKYRQFYENSLKRGKEYIPLFRDLLHSQGLSQLFVYLSMTESGFRSFATSPKKAAGLWQFMAATARRFDLKVNKNIDERYDPVASTQAAMKYIQTLYGIFGKWYLVMMAYNCGEGRLQKAIKVAGSDDFEILMKEKRSYIPFETRRYLQKIILLSIMGEKIKKSSKKEDKKIKDTILPDTEVLVNIYGGTTLLRLAKLLHINPKRLSKLNPHISHLHAGNISEEIGMTQIFIPVENLPYYRAFYRPPTLKELYRLHGYTHLMTHVVHKGDTLKKLARYYGATPLDLIIANQLASDILIQGSLIMVPVTERVFRRLQRF